MELEYYVPPDDAQRWFEYWCNERFEWYVRLGIPREMLRLRHHSKEELSHLSLIHICEYWGVGCSAHSHVALPDGSARRWWNVRTPERYCRLVEAGEPVEAAGELSLIHI